MTTPAAAPTLLAAVVLLLATACGDTPPSVASPEGADAPLAASVLAPELPAAGDFVHPITDPNPYFPLVPGTVWNYQADTEDGLETTVTTVTGATRTIQGITATVVRDQVSLEGDVVELTFDWYAQDRWGNVWYLGEASCEYEPGDYSRDFDPAVAGDCAASGGDPAGSWEAGSDVLGIGSLAEAGILMWADPFSHQGHKYRQEYYEGEAEDMAKVLHQDLTVTTEAGTFTGCIETMDFSPLEPGAREHKFYCPNVGLVLEVQPQGGRTRNELVSFGP